MITSVSIITALANKFHRGSIYALIITGYTIWGLYYASYYGRKRPTFPCYHAKMNGWVPEFTWHQTFYAHAHPFLYATAMAAGLALGDMLDKYNVHIHYTKGGTRKSKCGEKHKDVSQVMEEMINKRA